MMISPVGAMPYVYNTNVLSVNSMNRISAISSDVTVSRLDASGLTKQKSNTNPLRAGQSADFADILARQMSMGSMRASQILGDDTQAADTDLSSFQINKAVSAYSDSMV